MLEGGIHVKERGVGSNRGVPRVGLFCRSAIGSKWQVRK